jgi:dihydroorotate dehydrogenase
MAAKERCRVTDLARFLRAEDATSFVATAIRTLGVQRVSEELRISPGDVELISEGKVESVGLGGTFIPRLAAWIQVNSEELYRGTSRPIPPFDHLTGFWKNFYNGPRNQKSVTSGRLHNTQKFIDFELGFPFGVPACALTSNSKYIDFFAQRAFDLLTYKTVRDRPWPAHTFPQWAFAVDARDNMTCSDFDRGVTASLDPGVGRQNVVNSFGVPSLKSNEWQVDVWSAKSLLTAGQVLIVSVMGTPEEAADDAELTRQFAKTAALAVDAGADIVEANLSCPNTGGALICSQPDTSEAITRAVSAQLTSSRTPLFVKISYLDPSVLSEFVRRCGKYVQGIVAINTVSVPVVTTTGEPFFGKNRLHAGLSGPSIRSLALDTCRLVVEFRERYFYSCDWVIVGVGGVTSPRDFDAYVAIGVDAVQSCSGAWLNPDLARDIQER